MPSFQVPYAPSSIYQPNGRLVDLIRLAGEQSAESQRRSGEIQARMWGGLGQSFSDAANTIARAKENEPINALNKLKVQDALDLHKGHQVIDQGMKDYQPVGPQPEGAAAAPPQHPYLDSEGLADPKKITDLLAASGLGHLAPELLKGVEAQNSSILAYKQHQQEAGTKQTVMLGSVANTTLALMQSGMPFVNAAQHASSSMVATGAMDKQTVQKTIAELSQLPPDQVVAQLKEMKATAARLGPTKTLGEGAKEVDMFGDVIASNPKTEKPTEATLAADASDRTKTPEQRDSAKKALDALQAPVLSAREETARHNKELERIATLTAGRAEAAQKETARHNKAMEAAANPLGAMSGGKIGEASDIHGEDFLKTLPAPFANEIKAYAEGRRPFPTGMSQAKLQPLIQAVGQYDPTFDAANYTARSKARSDLTSPNGAGGKTINSLNTAIQHLGRLSDLIETENNYDIPLANAVVNPLRTAAGSTAVTNFNAVQPQAMKEIERLWRGAGGSEGDINALKDSLSKNAGRQQQREALQEFVNLVRGKLESTEQQRDNILGPAAKDVPILFEKNKAVLDKIEKRVGGTSTSGGGVSVTPPSGGKSYSFPDQAAADRFVADAKKKGLWK